MIYFATASKDATIYLRTPDQNSGLDEILEISKVYYLGIKDVSRALIKFDTTSISHSISNGDIILSDATLILKETKSEELPLEYNIYVYPISQSWEMGIGTRFDEVSTAGVTWNYREGDAKLDWLPGGTYESGSSGNYDGLGGTWYTEPSASQYFNCHTSDITVNIKPILQSWVSGVIPNNGIILKYSSEFEDNETVYGTVKLFSKETHTIYQPKIQIGWDDQIYTTGSLTEISSEDIKIGITNLKKQYVVGTTPTLKVFGRELFPIKTFSDTFQYDVVQRLPQETYYKVTDYASKDVIIPFSDYSKVSCNNVGNYLKLNLTNWESGRTYKIEFKTVINDNTIYFDNNLTFKVISE